MFIAYREGFGGGQGAERRGSFGRITKPPAQDAPGVITVKYSGLEYECNLSRQVAFYLNGEQPIITPHIPKGLVSTEVVIIFPADLAWAYYDASMFDKASYAPNG